MTNSDKLYDRFISAAWREIKSFFIPSISVAELILLFAVLVAKPPSALLAVLLCGWLMWKLGRASRND
jgi:hypothetical protein